MSSDYRKILESLCPSLDRTKTKETPTSRFRCLRNIDRASNGSRFHGTTCSNTFGRVR